MECGDYSVWGTLNSSSILNIDDINDQLLS